MVLEVRMNYIQYDFELFTHDAMLNCQMKGALNIFDGGMPYVEFSAMRCQKHSLQICYSKCL